MPEPRSTNLWAPMSLAATKQPDARPSRSVIPNPSTDEAETRTLDLARSAFLSDSDIAPVKRIFLPPYSCSILLRSFPSPTMNVRMFRVKQSVTHNIHVLIWNVESCDANDVNIFKPSSISVQVDSTSSQPDFVSWDPILQRV